MPDEETRHTGSKGSLLGCAAGVVFAVVVAFPFLLVWAWTGAHCRPMPQCQRAGEWALAGQMAVIVPLAVLLGFSVRAIVRWRMSRAMGGTAAARPPAWAVLSAAVLGLVALYSCSASISSRESACFAERASPTCPSLRLGTPAGPSTSLRTGRPASLDYEEASRARRSS